MSERRGGAGDPYGALSYILAGPLLYGGLGWVADHLMGTILFLPLGVVGGLALSIFVIYRRYGADERSPSRTTDERDTVTPLATPFLPLEGNAPPTFGVGSFDSRPLFPSAAWLHGDTAHFAWTDIWITNHIAQAVIGAVLVLAFWLWMSHNMKIVPGKKQFVGEYLYDMLRNTVARDILGHDYKTYLPYLISIFSFVLINNLFGQMFFFMFPTFSKIGFAWGLALLTWLLYNGAGIKKWGLPGYLKRMTVPSGVPIALLPLIIPLEILSNFIVRPITLGLRLFANLFAGHLVVLVFVLGGTYLMFVSEPIINKVAGGAAMILAFAIFALELLVAVLQAYIFTVLTAQYVSSAIAEEH